MISIRVAKLALNLPMLISSVRVAGILTRYVVPMNTVNVMFDDKSTVLPTGKVAANGVLSINSATNMVTCSIVAQGTVPSKTSAKTSFWSPSAFSYVVAVRDINYKITIPFEGSWKTLSKATTKAAGKFQFSGSYKMASQDLKAFQQNTKNHWLGLQVVSPNFFEAMYCGPIKYKVK